MEVRFTPQSADSVKACRDAMRDEIYAETISLVAFLECVEEGDEWASLNHSRVRELLTGFAREDAIRPMGEWVELMETFLEMDQSE